MPTPHSVDVQIRLLTALGNQLGAFGQQMVGLQSKANQLGRGMTQLFAVHQIEKFGRAASEMFGGLIDKAAVFETAMAKVGIATNTSGQALKDMGDLIQSTSARHLTTVTEAADMMSSLGRIGWSSDKIKAMSEPIAQFADVEHQERGLGFDEASKLAGTIATLYGAKTAQESQRVLENLFRAMNASPLAPGVLATSLKNFAPIGQRMGMTQEATFQTASIMGQMGLGSRGGTEMMDILLRLSGGTTSRSGFGHRGGEGSKALRELGMIDEHGANVSMRGGKFDVVTWMNTLLQAGERLKGNPTEFTKDLTEAYGRIGTKLAAAITPATLESLKEMMAGWGKTVSLQEAENRILDTLQAQETLFGSNLTNLATTLGSGTLPILKDLNASMATWTSDLDGWIKSHPALQRALGVGVLGGELIGKGAEFGAKAAETFLLYKMALGGGIPVQVKGGLPGGGSGSGAGLLGRGATALETAGSLVGPTVIAAAGAVAAGVLTVSTINAIVEETNKHLVGADSHDRQLKAAMSAAAATKGASAADRADLQNALEARRAEKGGKGISVAGETGDIHIHVKGRVEDETISVNIKDLRAAANRNLGLAPTTPSHSPSSGFGG